MLHEGIYRGWVKHQRHLPHPHQFTYPLAMVMLDLDTLQQQFNQSAFWSLERFNLISFYRRDYLKSSEKDLKTAVQDLIQQRCGEKFEGQVKILTHPRYLGFAFNPVTFYFCSDTQQQLRFIVAEINNTPWNERYAYVLQIDDTTDTQHLIFDFDKQFHVSPFMPMNIHNRWRFTFNQQALVVNMLLTQDDTKQFDVTMKLHAAPLTKPAMRWLPIKFPLQTVAVVFRIYWQALRLWIKKNPLIGHPQTPPKQLQAIPSVKQTKSADKHD